FAGMTAKPVFAGMMLCVLLFGSVALYAVETSMDGERLDLEMRMQTRVEEALAKILPAGQFVVVVRVEPVTKILSQKEEAPAEQDGFFLPGVPSIKKMDGSADAIRKLTDQLRPEKEVYHKFIKRITVT